MSVYAVAPLLALAGVSLGLRTTSVLIPRVPPLARLVASLIVGALLVTATLQLSEQYHVYDMGLGLLVSLAPVGIYDLAKWWLRRTR